MKKEINVAIGSRLREKREGMRYTREKLAELVDISPQFLADIESGKKGMSFSTLQKMSITLNASCDYLVMGKTSSADHSYLIEMVANIDEPYLPLAEELIQTFTKTIALKKLSSAESAGEKESCTSGPPSV